MQTLLSVVTKSAVDSLNITDGKPRTVLILSRNMYGFHDWLSKDVVKVLFTTTKVGEHMTPGIRKFYNHVECFEVGIFNTNCVFDINLTCTGLRAKSNGRIESF